MSSGKRWAVGPQIPDQEPTELDDMLTRWLDEHVFTAPEPVAAPPRPKRLRRAR
jgi:hypothetical protein